MPDDVIDFSTAADRAEVVFRAIGAGSVCWERPEGAGVFDSDRAKAVGEAALARLAELDQAATYTGEHGTEGALLGLATTRELLDELLARFGVDATANPSGPGDRYYGGASWARDRVHELREGIADNRADLLDYRTVGDKGGQ